MWLGRQRLKARVIAGFLVYWFGIMLAFQRMSVSSVVSGKMIAVI